MNKKLTKIIIINVTLIITAIVIIELLCYLFFTFRYRKIIFQQWKIGNKILMSYTLPNPFNVNGKYYTDYLRTFKKFSKKRPICFVGCSFTRGIYLNNEETFGYIAGNLSDRTVYLRGVDGTGLSLVYYQIKNKLIPQDSEYIIYTYIFNHLQRIYKFQIDSFSTELNLRYEYKNGKYQEIKPLSPIILNSSFLVKFLQEFIAYKRYNDDLCELYNFEEMLYFISSEMKKNYPNSKFVFVHYPTFEDKNYEFPPKFIEFLDKIDIMYIDAEQITKVPLYEKKYLTPIDNNHPNAEANRIYAHALVKALKL